LEGVGIEACEDIAEVSWEDAVGQPQEGLEPVEVDVAVVFDVGPGKLSADGGTDGDDKDVVEVVPTGLGPAWVGRF
jgi:hypothetical protein